MNYTAWELTAIDQFCGELCHSDETLIVSITNFSQEGLAFGQLFSLCFVNSLPNAAPLPILLPFSRFLYHMYFNLSLIHLCKPQATRHWRLW
jgi:hypothetical protein